MSVNYVFSGMIKGENELFSPFFNDTIPSGNRPKRVFDGSTVAVHVTVKDLNGQTFESKLYTLKFANFGNSFDTRDHKEFRFDRSFDANLLPKSNITLTAYINNRFAGNCEFDPLTVASEMTFNGSPRYLTSFSLEPQMHPQDTDISDLRIGFIPNYSEDPGASYPLISIITT